METETIKKISYLHNPPKYITPIHRDDIKDKRDEFLVDAIIRHKILSIWQNDICGTLNYPTTIIEFKPNTTENKQKKCVCMVKSCRSDSQLSQVTHKRVCQIIRSCLSESRCFLCDDMLARLFENADLNNLKESVEENITKSYRKSKAGNEFYANFDHLIPVFESDSLHGHVRTTCPMSGYVELAFPIVVSKKIIGALFVGQISLESRSDDEKVVRNNFLNSNDILKRLDEYLNKAKEMMYNVPCETVNEIIECLVNNTEISSPEYFPPVWDLKEVNGINKPDERSVISDKKSGDELSEYDIFINGEKRGIIQSIKLLEELLESELKRVREKYVRSHIEKARNSFFDAYKKMEFVDVILGTPQRKFWDTPKNALNNLVYSLDIRYISVFGLPEITPLESINNKDDIHNYESKLLQTMFLTQQGINDFNKNDSFKASEVCFNVNKVDAKDIPNSPKTFYNNDSSMQNGVVFKEDKYAKIHSGNKNHFLYFPMSGAKRLPLVVLISYDNNKDDSTLEVITSYLENFFTSIFYTFSSVVGHIAESRSENAMILYRHETSQIAAGIDNINNLYLNPDSDLRVSNRWVGKKQHDIYNDIDRFILLLSSMSQRIRIIQGRHELNKEDFESIWVVKEVFMNWTSAFSSTKVARYLDFIIPKTHENDDLRPIIKTDQTLLNQIVFNLFGNAVKYAYKGTNIYLEYSLPFEDSMEKIIRVTNYGIKITNDQEIPYKLYHIEENAKKFSHESDGIGLFVVNRAVELLGGGREHSSHSISDFVIPYMVPFLYLIENGEIERNEITPFDKKTVSEYEVEVKQELARLRKLGIYYEVCSGKNPLEKGNDMYPLTIQQIKNAIFAREKTYEVTFEVRLYD